MKPKIAIIIPTIRPERKDWMEEKWSDLWKKHEAHVYWVYDGDETHSHRHFFAAGGHSVAPIMFGPDKKESDLIFNYNDGVRNLGFLHAKKQQNPDIYITLDDDVRPMDNDPIQEHLDILGKRVPTSWFSSTLYPHYMRGFPYGVRSESEVVVSHGVWHGVPDLDAVTQLTQPDLQPEFYRGIVPRGCEFPVCGMNLAWTKAVAKWVYFAPMGPKTPYNRFADIWMGRRLKSKLDAASTALVTGFSRIWHERASDVWKNLEAEAAGLRHNEDPEVDWNGDDYCKAWKTNAIKWEDLMR